MTLMPECLDDFIAEDNRVRVIDAFVGDLDLTNSKVSSSLERVGLPIIPATC